MTIASAIATKQQQVADSYTAVSNKGGTLPQTQNLTNLATAISSIPSGGSTGKYQLLQRISDDGGNQIGTVSGFFTDRNDVEYAVICLDAIYRNSSVAYLSSDATLIIPSYRDQGLYGAKETATQNTTKIIETGKESTACIHCRNQSFIVDNVTYLGQLPNILELIDIFKNRVKINELDTSGGSIIIPTSTVTWSSSNYNLESAWAINAGGRVVNTNSHKSNYLCIPVLEIPNY